MPSIDDERDPAGATRLTAKARGSIDALVAALGGRGDDPHAIRLIAELMVELHAAEAVAARATGPNASADAAAADILAAEIAIRAAQRLFETTGSSDGFAALDGEGVLKKPARRRLHAIGDLVVNGVALGPLA